MEHQKRPRSFISQIEQNEYASDLVQYSSYITLPQLLPVDTQLLYRARVMNHQTIVIHTWAAETAHLKAYWGLARTSIMLQGWLSIKIDVSPSSYLCKAPARNKMTNIDRTSRPRFMDYYSSPRITCRRYSSINRTAAIHVVGSKRGLEPIKGITSERFRNSKSRADAD